MENYSGKQQYETNPIKDLLLFFRKIRLLLRIGRSRKKALKAKNEQKKLDAKKAKQWNRRKRYRLFKIVLKKSVRNLFKKDTAFAPPTVTAAAQKLNFYGEPIREQTKWYRRKRLITFVLRRLIHGWKTDQRKVKKNKLSTQTKVPDQLEKLIIGFNSTAYFLLAYITFQLINQLLTAFIAKQFGFNVLLTYHGIWYNVARTDWTADSVKTLFSIQPVTGLTLGLVSLYVYWRVKHFEGLLKLFFLWSFVFGFNAFFGGIFIGSLFSKGFGHVLIWSYMMDTAKLVASLASLTFMLLIGSFTQNLFLYSANTYFNELNKHNVRPFINAQFLYPLIIGNLLLFIIKLPGIEVYEGFMLLTPFIVMLPLFVSPNLPCELYFDNSHAGYRIRLRLLIVMLTLIVLYRIIFDVFTISF
jgi:hypothetical protein